MMKNRFKDFAMIAMVVVTGCSQGTPGGPGTTDTKSVKPVYGQTDDTFNLSVPMMSSTVQQGEQTEATIGIKRAKNFEEDVVLKFADLPKGVTVEPSDCEIKHGDSDAKITFTAGDDAKVGDFKIKVVGHPSKGGDAHVEFKLTVAAKDSFTLIPPRISTTLKQGESKTISVGIKRDKTFDQDVALEFGKLPVGITLEPAAPVIKHGDSDTQITLTSTDDASLGNFEIKLVGHPLIGADALAEFKMTVVKK